jgi:hypothetical protein
MNDNHTGQAVLSPLFAQNLVQRLEQLSNVDQFTDASNLALPFALFQLFQTDSSVASSSDSPALLGGCSLPRYDRAASSATHPREGDPATPPLRLTGALRAASYHTKPNRAGGGREKRG